MPTLAEYLDKYRPINWDEMGSSEKDLWEERFTRSWHKRYGQ
jgi:hypothetical protein